MKIQLIEATNSAVLFELNNTLFSANLFDVLDSEQVSAECLTPNATYVGGKYKLTKLVVEKLRDLLV